MPTTNIKDGNNSVTTLERKAVNDAMAYIKSLAELNDRNVSWALEAVEHAKSLSAKEALKNHVIDIIANNPRLLFNELEGRIVKVADKKVVLHTKDATIIQYEPDWKTNFLSIITNPNIAYILMLIAIYGIFFELMNPGSIVPGVLGAISGVIALYALNILPFNYAGLLLIVLGIGFMIIEVFVAGFGVLGIGGVVAFVFGSILLFDADTLGQSISIPLIIAFSIVSLAFFLMIMKLFLTSRSAKIVSGAEEIIGSYGDVIDVTEHGYYHLLLEGEIWSAISEDDLVVGQRVEVVELSGLVLKVKPIKE
jgi:membrane-bound serine protease (ClpP class)